MRLSQRLFRDPCTPPDLQDSVAVRHEVRIVEKMSSKQAGIASIAAKDSGAVLEDLPKHRLAGGLDVDQIDGPANPSPASSAIKAIFSVEVSGRPALRKGRYRFLVFCARGE